MLRRPFWSIEARANIQALDRGTAMRIFDALSRYLTSGEGDVKRLQGRDDEFRLRVGDYRICFTPVGDLVRIHWSVIAVRRTDEAGQLITLRANTGQQFFDEREMSFGLDHRKPRTRRH